jgi:primosomal protein N' (replication factor Y)
MPDFRSAERTFQLLTQVAGRAGRGDLRGRVLIQTYHPEHYALRYAVEQNYEKFYDHEIRFRQRMSYPPIVALASVLIRHPELETAPRQAAILKQALDHANADKQVRILGPASASISRLKNEYRLQIILRSQSRKKLRETLDTALDQAPALGGDLRRYNVEIDPLNLL